MEEYECLENKLIVETGDIDNKRRELKITTNRKICHTNTTQRNGRTIL